MSKQRADKLRRRAGAGRCIAFLAGIGADPVDQLLHRLCRHRGIDREHHRRRRDQRDRIEILDRIVAGMSKQKWIVGDVAAGHQDCVAVGRRLRDTHGADIAAGAGNVLDIEILAGLLGEFLRHQTADEVGRAAGREPDHDLDRPHRPILRHSGCR
jgi:hypothetical protein